MSLSLRTLKEAFGKESRVELYTPLTVQEVSLPTLKVFVEHRVLKDLSHRQAGGCLSRVLVP